MALYFGISEKMLPKLFQVPFFHVSGRISKQYKEVFNKQEAKVTLESVNGRSL